MSYKIKTISYDHGPHLFVCLAVLSIISLFAYVWAINSTARNIAARERLEHRVAQVAAKLDSLEFTYVNLKNSITLEQALERGFRETKNPLYVSRSPAALSFNTK